MSPLPREYPERPAAMTNGLLLDNTLDTSCLLPRIRSILYCAHGTDGVWGEVVMYRTYALNCEALESRHLLAATADIVVLIDESDSSTNPAPTTDRFEFAAELVKVLDQKLISRGIGGQPDTDHDDASTDPSDNDYPPAPENQYFVIGWGGNGTEETSEPVQPTHTIPPPPDPLVFTAAEAAQDILDLTPEPPPNANGGNEDGWEAIHFASTTSNIAFRENAAVHFLVITDSPEHDPTLEPLGPTLAHRRSDETEGPFFVKTYDEILDSLKKDALHDGNLVSDAVVTFVAGAEYDEDELVSFDTGAFSGYEILGADLNIQDEWDVDRRDDDGGAANDATVFIYDGETKNATADSSTEEINLLAHGFHFGDAIMFEATTFPQPQFDQDTEMFVGGLTGTDVFYVTTLFDANADTFQVSETIGGTPVPFSSNGLGLKVHLPARAVKVTDDFADNDYGSIVDDNLIGESFIDTPGGEPAYPAGVFNQEAFDGELYGYLTWATGGTYWDMDLLFDPLNLNDIDSPPVNMLMQAITDDMVQKIATQVVDFDGDLFATDAYGTYGLNPSGLIADIDDVDLLFAAFGTSNADTKAVFDLDESGAVDEFDLIRLIVLISTLR